MSHLAERFASAVRVLVGDGPVKQRLCRAYSDFLDGLDDAELPPTTRAAFADLAAALNRVAPAGKETRVHATVQKMSGAEAAEHASTIAKLYAELLTQSERAEPLKVVSSSTKTPRYLTQRP
jgi:hypothetical protein